MQLTWCHRIKSERTCVQLSDNKDNDGVHQCPGSNLTSVWLKLDEISHPGVYFFCFLAGSWLIPAVAANPAPFSSGQFRRRCVQLSDSSSHPRPFLPCLPASQLALRPGPRRRSSAHYPWWRATPPRLGNGQNAYWPTLLSQVRLCMILNCGAEIFYSNYCKNAPLHFPNFSHFK